MALFVFISAGQHVFVGHFVFGVAPSVRKDGVVGNKGVSLESYLDLIGILVNAFLAYEMHVGTGVMS